MNTVPTMISTKDLDYISDMFEWNFTAGKVANHFYQEIQNENLKEVAKEVAMMHQAHCQKLIQMLGGNYE